MRNGKGVYHFGEKNKIDGKWKNNLPHGEGILTYDNKKIEGEFRYGKLIKEQEVKKDKKHRKSSGGEHKHHKHDHHSHEHKSHKKKSENKLNEDNDKKKQDEDTTDKNEKKPVEIDCIPGICAKKQK